jgi:hypothetical protein
MISSAQKEVLRLETIVGDIHNYRLFVPGTILHAAQLMNERRTAQEPMRSELRNNTFYSLDFPFYSLEGEHRTEETLWLARGLNNLFFRNFSEAFEQLNRTDNYQPPVEEVRSIMQGDDTLKLRLRNLRLRGASAEAGYVEISTSGYDQLLPEQRKLAEWYFGNGSDFVENMHMLANDGIQKTKIHVLKPTYVQRAAWIRPIARVSKLFYLGSSRGGASAAVRTVYDRGAFRGEMK